MGPNPGWADEIDAFAARHGWAIRRGDYKRTYRQDNLILRVWYDSYRFTGFARAAISRHGYTISAIVRSDTVDSDAISRVVRGWLMPNTED